MEHPFSRRPVPVTNAERAAMALARVLDSARRLSKSSTREAVWVEAVCGRITEYDEIIRAQAHPEALEIDRDRRRRAKP